MSTVTYEQLSASRKTINIDSTVTERINTFSNNLAAAIKHSDKIIAFADFDCDGIFSALLLENIVGQFRKKVEVHISDRLSDGYGISKRAPYFVYEGDTVIILDMGAQEESIISAINSNTNNPAFIIDHHEMSDAMKMYPKDRILNFFDGSMKGCEPEWCTAGLVYKVFKALNPNNSDSSELIYAAIGTIADVVKVNTGRDDNAEIVRNGLQRVSLACKPDPYSQDALKALFVAAGLSDMRLITSKDIGWKFTPIINAMSRMVSNGGQKAFEILDVRNHATLIDVINMVNVNQQRKDLMKSIVDNNVNYKEYVAKIKNNLRNNPDTPPIAIYNSDKATKGTLGLISARLVNDIGVPSICVTKLQDGSYVGSARNVKGFPDALELATSFEVPGVKVGGHADAFGLSATNGEAMTQFAKSLAMAYKGVKRVEPEKTFIDITGMTVDKLYNLEPFGPDFERPLVQLTGRIRNIKILKNEWLSAQIEGTRIFGKAVPFVIEGAMVRAIGELGINSYTGRSGLIENLQVSYDSLEVI